MQEIFIYEDNEGNRIVTLLDNGKVVEKYDEKVDQNRLEGNIYLGRVENVLLGMQAAFVDIGEEKNTFIHIKDIIPKMSNETGNKLEKLSKHDIKNYIKVGMPILVQVKRDSTNKKGARVSTHITLPGRFIVLIPDSEFVTISQKIEDQNEKERLVKLIKNNLPKNFGAIIRTVVAAGFNAIIIPNDRQVLINSTVIKTSVGAVFDIDIVLVTNLNNTIKILKDNGFWIYGTVMKGEDYTKVD